VVRSLTGVGREDGEDIVARMSCCQVVLTVEEWFIHS